MLYAARAPIHSDQHIGGIVTKSSSQIVLDGIHADLWEAHLIH